MSSVLASGSIPKPTIVETGKQGIYFAHGHADGAAYTEPVSNVTRILDRAQQGDPEAAEELLPLVYEELRKLAAAKIGQQPPGARCSPRPWYTKPGFAWRATNTSSGRGAPTSSPPPPGHAAHLIDKARRKRALRHGGEQRRVDLDELDLACPTPDDHLLAVDEALASWLRAPTAGRTGQVRSFVGLTLRNGRGPRRLR